MRTLVGETPYAIENQSVIDIMYRTWFFILSVGILLPLRWLPNIMPKTTQMTFPVIATAVMMTCGELMLANPTISPPGPYCPGDMVTISFAGTNLPDGELIHVFLEDNSAYDPFDPSLTPIGNIPIEYNCTDCPTLLGLMSDPCSGSTDEEDHEFLMMSSGCGFNVADLLVDFDANNNIFGAPNADIGLTNPCQFVSPDPAWIAQLQSSTNCGSLINAAGPTSDIPAGATVIVLTDAGAPTIPFNFDDLCLNGQEIYIIQNSCERTTGAFTNNPTSPRTYSIAVGICADQITYSEDMGYSVHPTTEMAWRFEDGSYVVIGDCTTPPFQSVLYPDIPNSLASLTYTIPPGICGSGSGLVDFYISGMIDLAVPCEDILFTEPSASSFNVACLGMTLDTFISATSCENDFSGSIVANITSIGGTGPYTTDWDDANQPGNQSYPEDGFVFFTTPTGLGLNGVPAGTYYLIVADAFGCTDTATFIINISPPPVASIEIDSITCFGGTGDIEIINIVPLPIYPIIFDWDNIDIPGNEDFDGNMIDNEDAEDLYGVPAGTYVLTLTVTDFFQFSCEFIDTIVLTEPPLLSVTPIDGTVLCYGESTGTVSSIVTGGTMPYSFNWFTIGPDPDDQTETGLSAGPYNFVVTDANGCTSGILTAFVTQPSAPLAAMATGETIDCDDNTGDIDLTVTGGTMPFTFDWDDDGTGDNDDDEDLSGLNSGVYNVTVTDGNGCTAVASAMIDLNPPTFMLPPDEGSTVPCLNDAQVEPIPPPAFNSCGDPLDITLPPVEGPDPMCEGDKTYTFTYTDPATGDSDTWIYTYTIDYNAGLVAPMNGALTISCPAQGVDPGAPADILDACGLSISAVFVSVVSTPDPITCDGMIVWTYRYTACDGSTVDWTFTYTIDFSTGLTAPPAGSMTVACPVSAVDPGAPANIMDACGNTLLPVLVGSVSTPDPITCDGMVVWTYRYTACDGSTVDWTFTYTVDYSGALMPPPLGSSTVTCPAAAVDPGAPANINDACGNPIVPTLVGSVSNPNPITCDGTVVWTYRYTACDGSTADWTYTYTIDYSGVLMPPASGSSMVTCPAAAVDPGPPANINDACGNTIVPTLVGSVSNPNPIICDGTVVWTYRYTACDLTTVDWTYTYTVDYSGALVPPANGSMTVACPGDATNPGAPANITDACGRVITPTLIGSVSNPNPITCDGNVVWTYRYTACDNSFVDWTYTYTVDYSGIPVPPANGTANVSCAADAVNPGPPANITDACGRVLMPVLIGSVSTPDPITCDGTVVWTYRYTACDNSTADWTFTYTVNFSTGLTAPPAGSLTVACPADAVNPGAPANIMDACGNILVPVLIGSVSTPDPITCDGTVVWTYRYTACDGSTVDWTFTYTVDYTGTLMAPSSGSSTVTCPADAVNPGAPANILDACGNTLTPVLIGSVSNPNPITCDGTVVWTYRYTACDGSTADWTYTYTVDYSGVLMPPADGSSMVTCPAAAVDPGAPANILDACGNPIIPVLVGSVSNPNPITCDGTVIWTYRYTACDNTTADWTYTYTVDYSGALVPPANGSMTVACPGDATNPGAPANITDACGRVITPTLIGSVSNPDPLTCDGNVVWTYRYTACDNSSVDWTYTYTVDYSGTLVAPPNGSANISCAGDAVDPGSPGNITDACGRVLTPVLIGSVSNPDPIVCDGTVVWTYRYTACDNSTVDWTFTYTISFSTGLMAPPAGSVTVTCPADAVDPGAPANIMDACGNTLTPVLIGSVSTPDPITCDGTVVWTYRYTACDGSTVDWTFTYTIDYSGTLMPPSSGSSMVTCPVDAVDPGAPANILDACGNNLTPVLVGSVSNPNPITCDGTVVWTYRYTACDNTTADWTYTYTVDYSGTLMPPSNGSSMVTCPGDAVDPGAPANILDACGNTIVPMLIGSVSNPNPITCDGTVVWTYRYTACDNSTADWTFTYTVDYSGALVPPSNGSLTVACPADAVDPGAPANITDACGNSIIPVLIGSVSTPDPITCDGTVVWTYQYTACDNSTVDWTYTYTVDYSSTLVAPPNGSANISCAGDAVDPGSPGNIIDACGNTLVPVLIGSVSNPDPIVCDGTIIWTYRYTACDNSTVDWTFTYTISFSTGLMAPPAGSLTVTCPADAVDPGAPADIMDACGNILTPVLVGSVSTPDPITCDGNVVWTYRYTACDGSTVDWTFTYTVDYSGALTPPANGSAMVTCPADAVDPGAPADILDACGNTITPVLVGSSSTPDPIICDGTIVWTYQYEACDGSTVDWTYTYTIDYSGALVPPANGSSMVACPGDAVDPGSPADILDACGNPISAVLVGSVSNPDPITCDGTIVWTYRYTACDNSTVDWTFTYTIDYSGALVPPANGTANVSCAGDAVDPGSPGTITDACGRILSPVLIGSVSNPDPIVCDGTIVWTYRYTACDNSTVDWTFTYTISFSTGLMAPPAGSLTVACPADAVDPGAPANIMDACGNTLTPVLVGSVSTPDPITCDGTVVWTYQYTACDNSTVNWTYTYTVDYSGALVPPANGSSTVMCAVNAVDPGAPANILDACGNSISPVLVGSVTNPDPIVCDGTVVWTYRYTACDNSTVDWTYTYTIDNNGSLVPPANGSSTVPCPADAVDPGAPADILDACGNSISPVLVGSVENPNPVICDGTIIWTYQYTACDNSTVDWTYTYTIDYSGSLSAPANGSSTVSCAADAVDPGPPADITDACGRILSPVLIGSVSNPDPIVCDGTIVWTYQYTACDNSTVDWTFTYTINFSTGLTAPPAGSLTVDCPADAVDPGAPADILDACGNTLVPVLVGSVSNPDPITCDGTVVWTYRYTACDNSTVDWTFTYTVDYGGTLTLPGNGSSTIICPADAVDPGAPANVTDACGTILIPVLVGSVSTPDPITCDGTVVWTYRYTACDNSTADWTYTYTVDYSGALVPPANGSSTVSCAVDAIDPGAPANITDACGNTISPVLIGSVSNPDPITCDGTVEWTYRYTACDNSTVDWTYTYTVTYSGSLTPPANGSLTVACPSDAVDPGAPASILDACGNSIIPVLVGSSSTPDPITCDGTVVWTYQYTACDNSTVDWTFTYTVDYSSTLIPPANGSSIVNCLSDAVDPGPPAAITDACGNMINPILIGSISNPDPIICDGTVVWTYQYIACDNSTVDWTYTYTITFSTGLMPPPNSSSTVSCPSDAVDPGAPANIMDACGNTLVPVLIGAVSNPDPIICDGTVVWTYRYTACDNSTADWTYTYTVDYSGSLVPPADGSSTVTCASDAVDPGAPADIIDACGNSLTPVLVGSVSTPDPLTCDGSVVWTYRYTACDNSTVDWTYTYTVDYSGSLVPPADGSSTVTCSSDAVDPGAPADIIDACGNILTPLLVGSVSTPDPITCDGTVVWTYRYTACDNSTVDWTFTYTVDYSGALVPPANGSMTITCPGDAIDPGPPADIIDACGNTLSPTLVGSVSNPDPIVCNGTIVWTYSYTACDNSTVDWTYTYTINDNIPPTASNPAPVSVECAGSIPAPDINVVTDEADNCPAPVTVAFVSDVSDGGSCPETVTRTYSVTDACGNEILVTQSITVGDVIPPTASDPAPVTVECIGDVPAPDENVVIDEADNCGGMITVAFVSDVSGGGPCPEIITRTYSVTDECGNSILVTQLITIDDDTPPTASSPAPITVDCIADVPAPDINLIDDAADNCPAAIVVDFVGDVSDGASCPETITRTYSVTDACGNVTLVTQSIIVDDDILPTASNPSTLTAVCIADVPAPDISVVTDAADNCPGTITVAFVDDVSDGGSCPETITRTYSVTDACGNQILVTQSIIVNDDVPPTASNPVPIAVDCAGSIPAPDINEVTDEADNCPAPVTVAFVSDVSDGGSCPETVTRTYSVTDACGNEILVTQTITVGDIIPPTASDPAPVTVECIGDVPAPDANVVTDEADNCGGMITVAFVSDVSGGGPCPEIITRTYSVTDECGNSILVTQLITIDDDTPPTASSPAPITVDCIADVPAPDINLIDDAADNCPAAIVIDFVGDVSDGASCPETITRTYSVTDACGNVTLVTQSIIVDDDILPTASNPSTLTATCIADVPAPDISVVTDASDNCPGTITVAFVGDASDGGSCPETITRTYSVTDACGNEILVTQSIIINDDVPPTASNPAPIAVDCAGSIPAPDINEVIDEADNCPAPVTVAFVSDVSDGGSCPETVTRTYSVTDACGNEILVTQTITVGDIIPPTASDPTPVTVECIGDVPAPDINVVTDEADNCGGAITVAFVSDVSGGGPCPEVITRTYSVTDDCGNSILVTQLITVDDDTPPTASSPAPITVDCIADVPAPDINLITDEADNCPAAIVVAFVDDVSDGASCPETITRTYSVTDACGNVTLVTQSITVDDDILPTASNPSTLTATCIGDVPAPDISVVTDAADNCPGTITVAFVDDVSDGGSCPETITRTYSVTDACGNQILVTQSIIVNDDVPPTASNPAPIAVDCAGSIPVPDINEVTDEADNCPAPVTVAFVSDVSDGGTCPETVTRTYSVTDACGNEILVTQTITVGDIIPPTASDPAPLTVECVGDIPAPDINDVIDEADNCSGPLTVAFISDVSGGGPCPEIITRTYSVTDDCGNSIIVTQLITVDDDTPPTASNPAPITVACIGDVPPADISVITDAADNCPAPVMVAFVDDVPDGASCPLTITRTYSLTDGCGNQTLVTQLISVEDDILPTATNPSSIIVSGCNMPVPAPDLSVVTDAADNCSLPVVAFVSDVTDLVGCTETTTRTFSVTDACNNSITVEQLIIRTVDVTPPVFVNPPADLTVDCIAQAPPLVSLDYTDNCSPGGTVTGTETGPSGNPLTIVQEWTVTDDCGNTTSLTVTITVGNTNLDIDITENICPGESVTIYGEIYDTPGMYLDTLPGMGGECDTTVNIEIILDPLIESSVSASYCYGDSVLLNGVWYSSPNTYFDTIPSTTGGCDTALTITITEDPLINSMISASYCAGDSVLLNGVWYDSPNTYFDTIPSTTGGCDTALTITITEDQLLISSISASFCTGDSVLINGIWYDTQDTYMDTIPSTTGGCDTILTITITEESLIQSDIAASFCTGSSVFVYGIEYDIPGIYMDTIMSTTGGCDTIVTIIIDEEDLILNDVNASYCEGGSVFVYGTEYDMPGMYFDTISSTTGGCDTAVTIIIVEVSLPTIEVDASFCTGSSVIVYGVEYDMPGTYEVTVMSTTGGCDTLVTINIIEQALIQDTYDYAGCEGDGFSIIINGTEYNEMNPTGTEIIPGQAGACDTTLAVTLTFASNTPAEIMAAGPLCTESGVYTLMASSSDGTWSGSVTSDQFDPAALGTGIHQVIYTTPAGPCQSADTIDIEVYELTISCETIQDETAIGANDGIGQVTISGGMPPYDIEWSPGSGSGSLPADGDFQMIDLAPGDYTVTVTDNTGCTATCEFTIDSPIPCALMITDVFVQDASCPGVDNGVIIITAGGNMPPFEYSIDGINYFTTNQFDLLAPGSYTAFARDTAGCIETFNVNVGVGQGPELSVDALENANCGACNGSLVVDVTGGTTPYSYSIDGIMYGGSPNFPGLCAGNYLIYLIDDAGCTDTIPVTIGETDAPMITGVNIQNSSCGQADGSLTINATGGVGDLMYSIGGPFQTNPFFDGLLAGVYTIVVEDESGCSVTTTATIQDIGAPVINAIPTTPTSCGTFDGTATIMATGTLPLMYSLDGGANFQNDPFFDNLPAGTYTAVVMDGNGCLVSATVTITTTDGPLITDVDVTNTSCGEENGIIEIFASGGTGDLEYILNGDSYGDENEIPDLPAGVYEIEVWDDNNCSASMEVTILPSEGPDFDVYITPAHCGLADGCIELDGFDGQGPYTYSMTGLPPFSPVFLFCNKVSDFYTVAIMDANGCIHEEEVFLWEEEAPEIDEVIVTNPACGETTGTIEVIADGIDPLMYSKQLPVYQSSNIFTDVLPGTYTITVRDEAGCTSTATAIVVANPSPVLSLVVVDTECGLSTGSITASATGGLAPYEYKLNNGPFAPANVFTGLAAGSYTVIVRGTNGCTDTLTVTVISVGTKFGAVDDSFCAGSEYLFEGNIYTMEGEYDIPIPGGAVNGCDSIVTLTLTELPLIERVMTESICANEVYTYNGTDYSLEDTYVIDTLPAVTGCDTILILNLLVNPLDTTYIDTAICTGGVFTINGMDYTMEDEYLIDTVSASTGCDSVRILRLTVNDFNQITITEEICAGETYTINGMDYDMTGIFTIDTVPGPGGCDTVRILDLTVNLLPTANAGGDLTLDCDVISVILNGSAGGGSPLWTGPDINAGNENQLMPEVSLPGTYILTVTSPENCIAIDSVVVTLDPETVIANAGVDDSLSCDVLEITLQASPVGPEYSYLWTGPGINSTNETLPNPTITEEGLYTLVVTNTVTGCISAPDEVIISDISAVLIAIIQDPLSFNCFIDSIDLSTVGSSSGQNIVYAWFDGEGNLIATTPGLEITSDGMYVLIVEDTVSGCFGNDTVDVKDLTQYPAVDAGLPQVIDCNNPTAILNEGATNNNDLLVFQWTGPQGGIIGPDTLITAEAGIPGQYYYLMAMDTSNGCQNIDSVFVSDLTELPVADIEIAETISCIDETALLTIGMSSTGPGFMYVWSGPDLSNVVSETLETTVPGQYYLDVINEATGCSSSDTAEIVVPSEPQDLNATIEIPVCAGDDSGSITVTDVTGGTPDYLYSLDGGTPQSSPVFEGLFAGDYSIMVIDANGCTYGESVNIAEGLELTIDIGPDIDLELGDSITLWADVSLPWSQIDSIVWTPLDILSCSHCTNPVLYGLHTDVVTATVYAGGCLDEDMLVVRVDVDANIYIPNVFSPNDDGINDYVTVFTDHRVRRVVYLEIFDRWGNLVFIGEDFAPNDPMLGWDGSFKGKKMNPAVFAYSARVELINGDQVSRKGDITIVR